jgi:hypothetical protein
MAFADPAAVTPTGGTAQSMVRISQDGYNSIYRLRNALDDWTLNVRNTTYTKKNGKVTDRHNCELIHTIFPVSPAVIATVRKVYLTFENEQGDTVADCVAEVGGLLTFLGASTNANVTKMVGMQS